MLLCAALMAVLHIGASNGQSLGIPGGGLGAGGPEGPGAAGPGGLGAGGLGGIGAGICSIDPRCFFPCDATTLANAYPFIRQQVDCQQCMDLCYQFGPGVNNPTPYVCRSLVYNTKIGQCDLYATMDQQSMAALGRRKRSGGGGGGGGCGGGCQPKPPVKKSCPGSIYMVASGVSVCAGGQAGGVNASTTAAPGGSTGGSSSYAASSSSTSAAAPATTGAPTTSGAPSKKKAKAKDMKKDFAGAPCAVVWKDGKPNCNEGIALTGHNHHKESCKPTGAECAAARKRA